MRRSRDQGVPAASRSEPQPGEIYFEFRQVGKAIRVTAVDADSGTEVVVMGPASAAQSDLQDLAQRKLEARLAKERR